jgi:hypothetical protein
MRVSVPVVGRIGTRPGGLQTAVLPTLVDAGKTAMTVTVQVAAQASTPTEPAKPISDPARGDDLIQGMNHTYFGGRPSGFSEAAKGLWNLYLKRKAERAAELERESLQRNPVSEVGSAESGIGAVAEMRAQWLADP